MQSINGQSMPDAGISNGSVVLVDKVIPSENGHIVIALVDGDLPNNILQTRSKALRLVPVSPDFVYIKPTIK